MSFASRSLSFCRFGARSALAKNHKYTFNRIRAPFYRYERASGTKSWRTRSLVFAGAIGSAALIYAEYAGPAFHLDERGDTKVQIEPSTSMAFPTVLEPLGIPPLTLLGVGVRTVSFLRVKVYVVGFYADMSRIQLQKDASFDDQIDHIINNASCAIRIVPTRSTSFVHLRDAFLRSLRARMVLFRKQDIITPDEEDALEPPLQELRALFPNTPLSKNKPFLIYSAPTTPSQPRSLVLEGLGEISNAWIATQFFKTYFVGEGVSPALLNSVRENLVEWAY